MRGASASAVTPSAAVRVGTVRQPAGSEALGAARVLDGQAEPALAEEAHREPGAGRAGDRLREGQEDARRRRP